MTSMHWLWLGAIALMLLSLAVLLPPLLVENLSPVGEADEALRRLYQTQLVELEQEWLGGRLNDADYAQAVEELQRRLLGELTSLGHQSPGTTVYGCAVAVRYCWRCFSL